jgi:transcriptional regulator with XRE-family HTH domain
MLQQPELGRKIAELRKTKGLTQEELVEKCNLNVRTLQRIESGEAKPRTYTLKLIFEALGYNLNESNEVNHLKKWLIKQFHVNFIDLFNLKTKTMKKVTILSIAFSSILLGLFTIVSKSKAQDTAVQIQQEIEPKLSSNESVNNGYFSCDNSFQEDDELIGYGVKFNKNGVNVNVQLMKLNINTGKFNVGFVKGFFHTNYVEAYSPKTWIDKGELSYEAKDSIVVKEDNSQIILYGKAKLNSIRNESIEADKIVIHD